MVTPASVSGPIRLIITYMLNRMISEMEGLTKISISHVTPTRYLSFCLGDHIRELAHSTLHGLFNAGRVLSSFIAASVKVR